MERQFASSIRGWDPDDSEMYEEYEAVKAALDEARSLAREMLGWIGARRPNWGEQHPWLFEGR